MNLSEVTYPRDTKNRVQNLLVQEARRTPKLIPRWRKPAMLTFAGLALAGTTAAGVYVTMAPVEDKRDIRCYYRADLTTRPPVVGVAGETKRPYITTGIFIAGFDTENNPNPEDRNAGMKQVVDPINQCSRSWDMGNMYQTGINDDPIPEGFVSSTPGAMPTLEGETRTASPFSGPRYQGVRKLHTVPDRMRRRQHCRRRPRPR